MELPWALWHISAAISSRSLSLHFRAKLIAAIVLPVPARSLGLECLYTIPAARSSCIDLSKTLAGNSIGVVHFGSLATLDLAWLDNGRIQKLGGFIGLILITSPIGKNTFCMSSTRPKATLGCIAKTGGMTHLR